MAVITTSAIVSAIISSLIAFLMAVGSPMAIEKLGGVLGGVLSSVPTLIVPSSIAMVLSGSTKEKVFDGMMFYPSGMLINAIIWVAWKIIIPRFPVKFAHKLKLVALLVITLILWLSLALFNFFFIREKIQMPSTWIGAYSITIHIFIGLVTIVYFHKDAPRGSNQVTLLTHFLRGVIACIVIFIAVIISKYNPTVGGIIISFPTVALSTLVSLWLAQGEDVTNGALGPMIMASVSSSVYTMLYAACLKKMGPFPSALISYISAVVLVSAPTALFIRWLAARNQNTSYQQLNEISEESQIEKNPQNSDQKLDAFEAI